MAATVNMLRRKSSDLITVTVPDPSANPKVFGPGKKSNEPMTSCGDERSTRKPITKHPHQAKRRDAFNEINAANTPAKHGEVPPMEKTGINAASSGSTMTSANTNMLHLKASPTR